VNSATSAIDQAMMDMDRDRERSPACTFCDLAEGDTWSRVHYFQVSSMRDRSEIEQGNEENQIRFGKGCRSISARSGRPWPLQDHPEGDREVVHRRGSGAGRDGNTVESNETKSKSPMKEKAKSKP
jgi:hypothetical protein